MDLSQDEILQILKIIDESKFDELCIETDDLKLVLRKSGAASRVQEVRDARPQPAPVEAAKPAVPPAKVKSAVREKAPAPVPSLTPEEAGLVTVKAPILGTFYRAPSPGAPPYVDVGNLVNEGDTVCMIEVMKVFTSVVAATRGRVVEVCAENGQMVEFGQILFRIRPEAGGKEDAAV